MVNKVYKLSLVLIVSTAPFLVFAQNLTKTGNLLGSAKNIVTTILIPLAFTSALLFFFWGVAKYIWSVGGDAKEDGKKIMIWGIVGLFVMSSVWGFVYFIDTELGLNSENVIMKVPTITP